MTPSESQTTVEQIKTVVVDPEDIIEAFKRNRHDEHEHRSHVLRVSPPFEKDMKATLSLSEGRTSYPPDGDPVPIDLDPEAFINVHGDYDRYRTRISIPTWQESRSIARNDHGDDANEKIIEECHATAIKAWEQCVRTSLVDEVLLTSGPESGSEVWADVHYEGRSKPDV